MAGLDRDTPTPVRIVLHQRSRLMEVEFSDGASFRLSFEYLRVYSPSAEVRGHGPGQEVLQVGKREIEIASINTVGHYAIQPVFSDGHDSGLYSWDYLYDLGRREKELWRAYLDRLASAGASRDPVLAQGEGVGAHGKPVAMSATPEIGEVKR
jgi:DUF971 family protein